MNKNNGYNLLGTCYMAGMISLIFMWQNDCCYICFINEASEPQEGVSNLLKFTQLIISGQAKIQFQGLAMAKSLLLINTLFCLNY